MEDNAKIFLFQSDTLEPTGDLIDNRKSAPHTPGYSAELLAVAGVALPDHLVEVCCPQNVVFVRKLRQPPLGNFEIIPIVKNIEQAVF